MATYKLIELNNLSQLINQLKTLQATITPILEILSKKEGSITLDNPPEILQTGISPLAKVKIGRGGVKLADLVYDLIGEDVVFTPKQAMAMISMKTDWNPPRATDSIRIALDKDQRFERVGTNYRKKADV